MTSWATANCAEQRLETMKSEPIMLSKLPHPSSISEKTKHNLMLTAQENPMAAYSVILKNPSSLSSCIRSSGVGLRSSRLNSSSSMGKREQMMQIKRKGLKLSVQVPLAVMRPATVRRGRTQQGIEDLIRLSLPKISSLRRGSHCSNLAIMCVINELLSLDRIKSNHQRHKKADQASIVVTSRQMRQSQLSLQKRAAQLTIGTASSVFSKPCRTFIMRLVSYKSKRVHTQRMLRMEKVHFPPRNDSTLSVTTTFLSAHFFRICDFFKSAPYILKRSSVGLSPSKEVTGWPIRMSFWRTTRANTRQRSSLMSWGTCRRSLASTGRFFRVSSQVSQRHFWYQSQAILALVILLSRKAHPLLNCNSPAATLHPAYTAFPPQITTQLIRGSSAPHFPTIFFSNSAEGVISSFLKRTGKRSSCPTLRFSSISSSSSTRQCDSSEQQGPSFTQDSGGRVRVALSVTKVVQSSVGSSEKTRLNLQRFVVSK